MNPVFVEPDPDAASQIADRYPGATVIDTALWSKSGRGVLYITDQPGCSSMLHPDPDPRMPEATKRMLGISREVDVAFERADAELEKRGVVAEILKIDVQGGELEVLRGFGRHLDRVWCCELEASFLRSYREQPLFGEIYDEFEVPSKMIEKIDKNHWLLYGKIPMKSFNLELDLDLPENEDTLAGFLLSKLERIPRVGEKLDFGNLEFTVERVTARRIVSVILKIK